MTHLRIELNNNIADTEEVSSSVIEKLYGLVSSGDLDVSSNLKGRINADRTYRTYANALMQEYPLLIITADDYAIPFEDQNMLNYLIGLGIGSNGLITEGQAALVTSVANSVNTTVTKFNELRHFTNVISSKNGYTGSTDGNIKFMGWTALEEVDISNFVSIGHNNAYAYGDTFLNCTSLKTVTASNKLENIGYSAFRGCTNLEYISGLSGVITIDTGAFANDSKLLNRTFSNVEINLHTASGGSGGAFEGCSLLEELLLSASCTTIPSNTFKNCTNLATINLSNVTSIEALAFNGCTSLTSIDLSNVTSIGQYTFANSSIPSVVWSDTVTNIPENCFINCKQLTSISNTNNVTTIGRSAFDGSNIETISLPALTQLSPYTFANSGLQLVSELGLITSVPESSFRGCTNLTSVTLPNTVTEINDLAFFRDFSLVHINIPSSCTKIARQAFDTCSNLQDTLDLSNVTTIGERAFINCTALTSIGSLSNVTRLEDSAFIGCSNIVGLINMPNLTYLGAKVFYGCKKITQISIPSTITYYGESLFRESGITSFTIPSGVTIDAVVFRDCTDLQTVVIGSNTGDSCFEGCASLSNVTILEGVTELASLSFRNTAITIIDLPSTITSIGSEQFNLCYLLNTIIIRATTPPTGNDWYAGLNGNATIYVPDASVNDYKASTAFSALSSRIFGISQMPNS